MAAERALLVEEEDPVALGVMAADLRERGRGLLVELCEVVGGSYFCLGGTLPVLLCFSLVSLASRLGGERASDVGERERMCW